MVIIVFKFYLIWIGIVCGKMKIDYCYFNILGWNIFFVFQLIIKNKEDLICCVEDILFVCECYFLVIIVELYDFEKMFEDFWYVYECNDEVLECIYIGCCFKNDIECLEKFFELYMEMIVKKLDRL